MWRGIWLVAAAACLAACGRTDAPAAKQPDRPAVLADGFDPRTLDLDRPCTLLRENDAERISGQPFYRTLAMNRVADDRVRCAQAVGAGGLHSLVEATVITPLAGNTPAETFQALCRADAIDGPQPQRSVEAASVPEESPPPIPQNACRLANSAYAIEADARVVVVMVRGGAGEIDPVGSRRLVAMLAPRISAAR